MRALPVDSALLDGEAIVFRSDGHSDFAALRTNRGAAQASFVAYDLLQFQGEDWRRLPLEIRRAQLESCVSGIDAIKFSEVIEADGATVFAHACKLGVEGIVSKRLGGLYASGRLPELAESQESGVSTAVKRRMGSLLGRVNQIRTSFSRRP